jgi:hypothetical protein
LEFFIGRIVNLLRVTCDNNGQESFIVGGDLTKLLANVDTLQLLISCHRNRIRSETIKLKLHGLSPRANYTDRATAACRRSDCQLLRIEGAKWSAWRIPTAVFSVF